MDSLHIEYRVCVIEHLLWEDDTFEYRFYPDYGLIDLLEADTFQGIPGIDLSLRKEVYVRKNLLPTFISERVPSKNREDYFELLEEAGLQVMNPIQYMIRTRKKYSGDSLYVIEYEEPKKIMISEIEDRRNAFELTKRILDCVAARNRVLLGDGTPIDLPCVFKTLLFLYGKALDKRKEKQKEGIAKARKEGKYVGRKPTIIEKIRLQEAEERIARKEITKREAARTLGISIDKFYRLEKELKKEKETRL